MSLLIDSTHIPGTSGPSNLLGAWDTDLISNRDLLSAESGEMVNYQVIPTHEVLSIT